MTCESFWRGYPRAAISALLFFIGAAAVHATDTYNLSNHQLTIQSIEIGTATYSNMVVTIHNIITPPSGSSANGSIDSYDPHTNLLTVQTVIVGSATYHNAVVTVAGLVSCGAERGADDYNGNVLNIGLVQVGAATYHGVQITVGSVVSVGGGMPSYVPDTYNAGTNELAIPAVQVGNRVFTNVVITVGNLLFVSGVASSFEESSVYSFGASGSDGANPQAGLIESDGLLYGTTSTGGGLGNGGTVFTIDPNSGFESVLYSFCSVGGAQCTDGESPVAGLIRASDGNFYGTTEIGGEGGAGTVFKLTPGGAETVLHSFCGTSGSAGCPAGDGEEPQAALVQASDGYFYGTTFTGGASNQGTVFRLTPGGTETVLHSFSGGVNNSTDGAGPQSTLIQASDGNLYGTTEFGGLDGNGTVFKITLAGVITQLYSFLRVSDGHNPKAGVIQGGDGNFYGTTYTGGSTNGGTVFRVTSTGAETVLYSFNQSQVSTDGYAPRSGLQQGNDGNLYGVTNDGGTSDPGTIFKITPDGVETVLYSFGSGGTAAIYPQASLFEDSSGIFWGTTYEGGANASGTVFKISNLQILNN